MSAPDTNVEREEQKHKTPLLGIGGSILWAGVLLVGLIVWISYNGSTPEEQGVQIEVVPGEGATVEEN